MLIDDLLWLIIIYTFADFKNCKKNNLFNFYVSGAGGKIKIQNPETRIYIKPVKTRKL